MIFIKFSEGLESPGLENLSPQNLSSPPKLRMEGSNVSTIIIEWGESNSDIANSVVYEVNYTLSPLIGDTSSGMMVVSLIEFTYICMLYCTFAFYT